MQEENDIMALKITIKKINYECKGGFCNVYEKNWNDTFSLYANTVQRRFCQRLDGAGQL